MKCNAAYEITLKPSKNQPPGTRNTTLKTVPMGRLRWTYEDNKKWSQKLSSAPDPNPIVFQDTYILSYKALSETASQMMEASSLADCDFSGKYDSLDLEGSWQVWDYLK